jgi:hypothetical protein
MAKFFAQPYSDGNPSSLHYTLGYRGYDLKWHAPPLFGRWGFFLCTLTCLSCVAARSIAMGQTRPFSKQSDEWTRSCRGRWVPSCNAQRPLMQSVRRAIDCKLTAPLGDGLCRVHANGSLAPPGLMSGIEP